jgi:CRP-like cAMP-binding protein
MLRGIELLLQAPCLAGVDNAELERVPLRRSDYAAGEWLFTPHTPTRDLYFIAAGSIDVFDASVHDRLRPLLRAVPGDVLGEHRLGRRPSPLAARAVADTVVYRWPGEELAAFLASHAQVHDSLRFLDESRRLAGRMGFTWLGDGETVHGLARKHPALLIRALLLPMLALSAGLGILAAAGLSESGVTASVGAGLCALGLGLGVWRGLDWRNDFYVATDRRVVWLEKVIGIYDNRQESPLKMILSVAVDSGLIGRQLGFGDVTVRTYTGAITFKDAPHPHAFAATIESLGRRWQLSTRQSDRQTIHRRQQRLASGFGSAACLRPADADAQRLDVPVSITDPEVAEEAVNTYVNTWLLLSLLPRPCCSCRPWRWRLVFGDRRYSARACSTRWWRSPGWRRRYGGRTNTPTGPTTSTRSPRPTSSTSIASRSDERVVRWRRWRTSSAPRSTAEARSASC